MKSLKACKREIKSVMNTAGNVSTFDHCVTNRHIFQNTHTHATPPSTPLTTDLLPGVVSNCG